MNSVFEAYLNFRGIGNPCSKIWFFGLEEGGEESQERIEEGLKTIHNFPYWIEKEELRKSHTPVWDFISKITVQLYKMPCDWWIYRDQMFSESGSRTFLTELYPLPKRNLKSWPPHYKDLFGFDKESLNEYLSLVNQFRFPLLRSIWNEYNPSVTICFGKSGWKDFKALLEITDENAESYAEGKIQYYKNKHVLLVPFMGFGHMSQALINEICLTTKKSLG